MSKKKKAVRKKQPEPAYSPKPKPARKTYRLCRLTEESPSDGPLDSPAGG